MTQADYYLLHGIEAGSYPKYEQFDCFNWLKDKKETGLVKTMVISFHATAELLDEILTKHPEIEFVQLQIDVVGVLDMLFVLFSGHGKSPFL